MTSRKLSRWYPAVGKRFLDVIVGSMLLMITLPIQGVVAIVVLCDVGAPILFKQPRPGRHGYVFTVLKFRSMRVEAMLPECSNADEERLTAAGRLLRATSLDELPQLINVVRGDMSLIGPRPLLVESLPLYSMEQAKRHMVRPGLTGWAQVNGRNAVTWAERLRQDSWYAENVSLSLDMRILWRTLWTVISRRGVSGDAMSTMSKFDGSSGD